MSFSRIYKVWLKVENDNLVIGGHSCDSNCFPKPTKYELKNSDGEVMWTKPLSSVRGFIISLCKSYDSSMIREGRDYSGVEAWALWSGRLKMVGVLLGDMPSRGALSDLGVGVRRGIPINSPEERFLSFQKGDVLLYDEAKRLVETYDSRSVRIPVCVVNQNKTRFIGRLGFISGCGLCAYGRGLSRSGPSLWPDDTLVVTKTYRLSIGRDKQEYLKPPARGGLAALSDPTLSVAVTPNGAVFCAYPYSPAEYAFIDGKRAYDCTVAEALRTNPDTSSNQTPAVLLSNEHGDALLSFYADYHPELGLKLIPVSDFCALYMADSLVA